MAPEQIRGRPLDARSDVFGASIILWELITGQALFTGESPHEVMNQVLEGNIVAPSRLRAEVPAGLDAVVLKGLARSPEERFSSAEEMTLALEASVAPAGAREVSAWVSTYAAAAIFERGRLVASLEALPLQVETSPPSAGSPASLATPLAAASGLVTATVPALPAAPEGKSSGSSRRTKLIVAASVAVALAGAAVAVTVGTRSARGLEAAQPVPTPPQPQDSDPTPPAAAAVAMPQPPPTAEAPPAAGSPSPPQPVAAVGPAKVPVATAPRARPVRRAAQKKCDPPYTLDGRGIRIPKPECF
jgi:serine/threonine-protein kinase